MTSIARDLVEKQGFDDWGLVSWPLDSAAEARKGVWKRRQTHWLAENKHADMAFLAKNAETAFSPDQLLPGLRSILVCAFNYHQGPRLRQPAGPGSGKIAMYAWGRDYHRVIRGKLKVLMKGLETSYPEDSCKAFVDSNPLQERFFAQEAGLGFIGRHTLLIHPDFGSKIFLGMVLSTIPASEFSLPGKQTPRQPGIQCPSGCSRCIDQCPTQAISKDGGVDSRKCISWLTIESRLPLLKEQGEKLDGWLFGCDVCQDVCPFSVRTKPCNENDFLLHRAGPEVPLCEIMAMESHDDLVRRFSGSPVLRAGLETLKDTARALKGVDYQEKTPGC